MPRTWVQYPVATTNSLSETPAPGEPSPPPSESTCIGVHAASPPQRHIIKINMNIKGQENCPRAAPYDYREGLSRRVTEEGRHAKRGWLRAKGWRPRLNQSGEIRKLPVTARSASWSIGKKGIETSHPFLALPPPCLFLRNELNP